MNDIPLVDLTPAHAGNAEGEKAVAYEIDHACRELGFFSLCGHNLDKSIFADAHSASREFFRLPLSEKVKCKLPTGATRSADDYTPYGYSGLLDENAYAYMGQFGKPSDYVEKYSTGRLILNDDEPLPFLDDEKGSRVRLALKRYFVGCCELAARVAELLTIPLGLPRDFFAQRIDSSEDSLRSMMYPSFTPEFANHQGMAEHTDGTLMTILTQTAPGIEVKSRSGEWISPKPRDLDHFVVNIGDLLAHWTKGEYLSTAHRVVLRDHERHALVFIK